MENIWVATIQQSIFPTDHKKFYSRYQDWEYGVLQGSLVMNTDVNIRANFLGRFPAYYGGRPRGRFSNYVLEWPWYLS